MPAPADPRLYARLEAAAERAAAVLTGDAPIPIGTSHDVIGEALALVIAALDGRDGDPDLEDGADAELEGATLLCADLESQWRLTFIRGCGGPLPADVCGVVDPREETLRLRERHAAFAHSRRRGIDVYCRAR